MSSWCNETWQGKPTPAPLRLPWIPQDMTWDLTWAAALKSPHCLDCTTSIKIWTTSSYFYILKWTLLTNVKRLCPNSTMPILIKRNWNEYCKSCFAHVNTIQTTSHLTQYGENGLNIVHCNLIILPTLKGNSIIPMHINRANPYILPNFTALLSFPFVFLFYFPLIREKHGLVELPGAFASHSQLLNKLTTFTKIWTNFMQLDSTLTSYVYIFYNQ
jgi:hypothetical protein